MRRVAGGLGWAVLLLGLVGVGLFVGLQAIRGISPPVVAVEPGEGVPGFSAGDAALLRRAPIDEVDVGDVVAARSSGVVRVGLVQTADQEGSTVEYRLVGLPNGDTIETDHGSVVGLADRKIPLVGWLLLPLRDRFAQIAFAAVAVLLVLGLLAMRQAPPVAAGEPVWASDAFALPPGRDRTRRTGPVVEPGPEPFVAGPVGVAYGERPMSITPEDLRQVKFAQTKRGYDTEAVDRALDSVADAIEQLLAERQQMLEHLQRVEAEVERYKGMEATLSHTLAMAERTAEEMKAEAQAEAQRIVSAAQQQAGGMASVPPDAMVQLLGESRAIRSLLQAVLAQGVPPQGGPPPQAQPQPQPQQAPPPPPPQAQPQYQAPPPQQQPHPQAPPQQQPRPNWTPPPGQPPYQQ